MVRQGLKEGTRRNICTCSNCSCKTNGIRRTAQDGVPEKDGAGPLTAERIGIEWNFRAKSCCKFQGQACKELFFNFFGTSPPSRSLNRRNLYTKTPSKRNSRPDKPLLPNKRMRKFDWSAKIIYSAVFIQPLLNNTNTMTCRKYDT